MKWFRLWTEILDDPKLAKLDDGNYRRFINLLAIACEQDKQDHVCGRVEDLAWRTRDDPIKMECALQKLLDLKILTRNDNSYLFPAWDRRQFKSDRSGDRWRNWYAKRKVLGIKSSIALALFLHMAGGINRWYWKYMPYYDKLAHIVSALALGLLIFAFFLVLDSWEMRVRPSRILAGIFVLVLFFAIAWEISEYYIDLLVQSTYNNGVMDSILDTISNIIGALLAVVVAQYYLKSVPEGKTPGYLLQTDK